MALKILTRTRKRVINKAILPCKVYIGSSTKIMYKNPGYGLPECHQKEWEMKPSLQQQKGSWASSKWSCSEQPSCSRNNSWRLSQAIYLAVSVQPVQNHLKTCHTVVPSLGRKVEGVLHLETGNLHLVVQDTLGRVGHQGKIVCPVDHLSVVIIEWPNLSREFWRDLYTFQHFIVICWISYLHISVSDFLEFCIKFSQESFFYWPETCKFVYPLGTC